MNPPDIPDMIRKLVAREISSYGWKSTQYRQRARKMPQQAKTLEMNARRAEYRVAELEAALSDFDERRATFTARQALAEIEAPAQAIPPTLGRCPTCGAAGVTRERRPGGNDQCQNGHTYPSAFAKQPQAHPGT